MKNRALPLFAVLAAAALAAACSLHLPYGTYEDHGVRVLLQVEPEDADVLLNGRFIGLALEFATPDSALHLASRFNELLLRKRGFREEVVDLSGYGGEKITLRFALQPLPVPPAAESAPERPAAPEPTPPPQPGREAESGRAPLGGASQTAVILEVAPPEAAIYLDGRFFGLAPDTGLIENLRLPAGHYEFAVFKPGFRPVSRRVRVPPQESFRLVIRLVKE